MLRIACSDRRRVPASGVCILMPHTLGAAAKAVGKNRTTLLRAVKSGKLSATYDEALGGWLVEPAELHRVFPPIIAADAGASPAHGRASTRIIPASAAQGAASGEVRELRARLEAFEAGQRLRDEVIDDLRRRLDTATEQLGDALQQVRLLTDQRTPVRRSWWRWR
jgi:hypothetical protein